MYWTHLYQHDRHLGGAFFFARRYILTAYHCVKAVPADDPEIEARLPNGETVPARLIDRRKEPDLALLEVPYDQAMGLEFLAPIVGRCAAEDQWVGPCRPPRNSDPALRGVVIEPASKYRCVGGAEIEAAQLKTEVEIGDFSGYSGGPVEQAKYGGPPLVYGLLVEQYPDRQNPQRATNVLFATTIAYIVRTFPVLDPLTSLQGIIGKDIVPQQQSLSDDPAEPVDVAKSEGSDHISTESLTRAFKLLSLWFSGGLINAHEFGTLRLQVARNILMQTSEESHDVDH